MIDEDRILELEKLRQVTMERYGFGTNIMRNIRICAECGLPSAAKERNCRSCGGKLPRETLFQQYRKRHCFCFRCDTVVADNVRFCPECGTRIPAGKCLKIFK